MWSNNNFSHQFQIASNTIPAAKVDMKKYRKALKKTGALKKLYKEKYGNDMTSEKLANFKEALEFVVGNNDNPGTVSKSNVFYSQILPLQDV